MEPETYRDQHLEMDHRRHEVSVDGKLVHLTPKEWNLLAVFVKNPNMFIRTKELWHAVWGEGVYYQGSDPVKWHIKRLRDKLGFTLCGPIVTVRGFGYRYDRLSGG